MLVHICCSVDSDYFLKRLCNFYKPKELIAYFYDPNIHPYSEYLLRLNDVKRSCKKLKIKFLAGEYNFKNWLCGANGLENEPEKGARCAYCFDFRLENTAQKALELGQKSITTTLLMSPKKDFKILSASLEKICDKYGLDFITPDFRKNGGTTEQFQNAKEQKLYHQNYCGCLYALNMSRSEANLTELSCPISRQIQPGSAAWREKIFEKVRKLEKKGKNFELLKTKILNYRLIHAKLTLNNELKYSYFIFKSVLNKENSSFTISEIKNDKIYNAKDYILLISLKLFNKLSKCDFKSTKELYFHAPSLKKELKVRKKLCGTLSTNPIIVLDKILPGKVAITLKTSEFSSCEQSLYLN